MARVKLKHLNRLKSDYLKPKKGFPSAQEGKDGDFTLRAIPETGLKLFGKYGGKWYTIGDTFYKVIRGAGPGQKPSNPIKPSPRSHFSGNRGELKMYDNMHLADSILLH
jgi:hypothetical protein